MADTRQKAEEFVTIDTVHRGDVSWWWTDEKLFDTGYHIKVNDSMDKKTAELERKYDVQRDTRYCTQFEGVLFEGENRDSVEAAARELARHLARFTGIRPL
jgi:hypothetical protein